MTSTAAFRFPRIRTASAREPGDAESRGYAAGYAEGLRRAEAEAEAAAARIRAREEDRRTRAAEEAARRDRALASALAALRDAVLPTVADAQRMLEHSAVDLAEAIIGVELSTADAAARSVAARVLAGVSGPVRVRLRAHPDVAPLLHDLDAGDARVTVVADPALDSADAVAEFEDGFLDCRIRAAVERARTAVNGGDL